MVEEKVLRSTEKKRAAYNQNGACWADLPDDLWDSIFSKVFSLYDIIRVGLVCKAWNSKALIHREKRINLINHRPPLLFTNIKYPHPKNSQSKKQYWKRKQYLYDVYSASSFSTTQAHEILNFSLNIPYRYKHKKCYGSSLGWLFYKDRKDSVIVLLNPITRTIIRLPPSCSALCCKNFTLSSDPFLGSFEVMAFRDTSDLVAHFRFGDQFWTVPNKYGLHLCGFAFYQNCWLGVSPSGNIFRLNLVRNSSNDGPLIEYQPIPQLLNHKPDLSIFVETTKGDLLMVHLYYDPGMHPNIFKIVCSKNGEFTIIQDCNPCEILDGHCLFLNFDRLQGISVLASDYGGIFRANSIYSILAAMVKGGTTNYLIWITQEYNMEKGYIEWKEQRLPIPTGNADGFGSFWIVPSI